MGGPFIGELSDDEVRAIVRFLRGGTEINQQRADQLLAEAGDGEAAEAEPAPANDSNEG